MDMMANYTHKPIDISDTGTILRGLAEKLANIPMAKECRGPMEYYSDVAVKMCQDYKADAAIFSGGIACKNSWGIAKLIKDKIYDEVGIPTAIFEIDVMDPRVVSSETIRATLEDFFSVLDWR